MPDTPFVAALRAQFPAAAADYDRLAAIHPGRPTFAGLIADMAAIAKNALESRGLVTEADFQRAGLSVHGLVEEPTVALPRAVSDPEIAHFGAAVMALVAADWRAARRVRAEGGVARAAQFLIGCAGGAGAVALLRAAGVA